MNSLDTLTPHHERFTKRRPPRAQQTTSNAARMRMSRAQWDLLLLKTPLAAPRSRLQRAARVSCENQKRGPVQRADSTRTAAERRAQRSTILRRLMMQAVERRAMAASLLTLAIAAVTVQVVRAAPTPTGSVKYGIVFDAGSSGTRIHVYSWRVGGGGPKDAFDLIGDDLLKKKPGLSAYKEKTAEAGSSLTELLNHARAKIPAALHAETPIFLMATAGLRMVGEKAKDEILASVCAELSSSGFLFRCGRRLALALTLTPTPHLDPKPHSQGRAPART